MMVIYFYFWKVPSLKTRDVRTNIIKCTGDTLTEYKTLSNVSYDLLAFLLERYAVFIIRSNNR